MMRNIIIVLLIFLVTVALAVGGMWATGVLKTNASEKDKVEKKGIAGEKGKSSENGKVVNRANMSEAMSNEWVPALKKLVEEDDKKIEELKRLREERKKELAGLKAIKSSIVDLVNELLPSEKLTEDDFENQKEKIKKIVLDLKVRKGLEDDYSELTSTVLGMKAKSAAKMLEDTEGPGSLDKAAKVLRRIGVKERAKILEEMDPKKARQILEQMIGEGKKKEGVKGQ